MGLLRADATKHSAVIVCKCGARFVASTRAAAWRAGAAHLEAAHPGTVKHANLNARRLEARSA